MTQFRFSCSGYFPTNKWDMFSIHRTCQMLVLVYLLFMKSVNSLTVSENFYTDSLISGHGGKNGSLNVDQLQKLLDDSRTPTSRPGARTSMPDNCSTNGIVVGPQTSFDECLKNKCLTAKDIFALHGIATNTSIKAAEFKKLLPTVLFEIQKKGCMNTTTVSPTGASPPSPAEVWGYSFLFVTVINLCSLMGFGFMPLMKKQIYHILLMFFVALAVGTLAASSLFFLIPDAFGLLEIEEEKQAHGLTYTSFVYKATMVLAGIYLFFLVERILKMIMDYKEKKDGKKLEDLDNLPICSVRTHTDVEIDPEQKVPPNIGQTCKIAQTDSECEELDKHDEVASNKVDEGTVNPGFCHSSEAGNTNRVKPTLNEVTTHVKQPEKQTIKKIAPVAWMIIFGDALHNFIDGLSIGAAFSTKILAGVSVSLAVLCEEFPHELGDFAILLNSGMSVKQALAYNFLSACACYVGLVIGILLGELTAASKWIFALAGGMFLYISLADMMPEVNHASESKENKAYNLSNTKIFIIQNVGLLVGFGLMFILALYGGNIKFG